VCTNNTQKKPQNIYDIQSILFCPAQFWRSSLTFLNLPSKLGKDGIPRRELLLFLSCLVLFGEIFEDSENSKSVWCSSPIIKRKYTTPSLNNHTKYTTKPHKKKQT